MCVCVFVLCQKLHKSNISINRPYFCLLRMLSTHTRTTKHLFTAVYWLGQHIRSREQFAQSYATLSARHFRLWVFSFISFYSVWMAFAFSSVCETRYSHHLLFYSRRVRSLCARARCSKANALCAPSVQTFVESSAAAMWSGWCVCVRL